MLSRVVITACLLLVSLVGDAKLTVPDSLLTIQNAYRYNIVSPDTAQAILSTLRERKMEPEWRIDFAEGDLNVNMRQFRKALPFYQKVNDNEAVDDSTHVQLLLMKRMMDCYDAIYNDEALVEVMLRLRKKAQSCGDKAFEAMTYFTSGRWHHYHGQREKGYQSCLDAVEMMKSSDYPSKHIELRNFYAELLRMYAHDGRYDEAIRMSQLQEAEARQPSPASILNARERGLRRVYALRACVMACAGRMAEADKAYAAWKQTLGGNDVDNMAVYDYLVASRHYQEAHEILKRFREFLQTQGDTISYRMLSVFNKAAILHMYMGDYEGSASFGQKLGVLADTLHSRRSGEQMQITYDLFMEQEASHQKSKWMIVLMAALAALFIVALVVLYYVRYIHRRNRQMLKVLNSLDAYRRAVINGEPPTSPQAVAALEAVRALQTSGHLSEGEEEPDDEDRRLFVEMDKQVTRDRLFLKPGLGRDDLMRLIGVDKNRFGKMMGKYSDASNTSVYINTKRVEYGAKLLVEHPEYTIATVATECGMTNTVTFNRTFKDIYNMTPSEYREKMTAMLQTNI